MLFAVVFLFQRIPDLHERKESGESAGPNTYKIQKIT